MMAVRRDRVCPPHDLSPSPARSGPDGAGALNGDVRNALFLSILMHLGQSLHSDCSACSSAGPDPDPPGAAEPGCRESGARMEVAALLSPAPRRCPAFWGLCGHFPWPPHLSCSRAVLTASSTWCLGQVPAPAATAPAERHTCLNPLPTSSTPGETPWDHHGPAPQHLLKAGCASCSCCRQGKSYVCLTADSANHNVLLPTEMLINAP